VPMCNVSVSAVSKLVSAFCYLLVLRSFYSVKLGGKRMHLEFMGSPSKYLLESVVWCVRTGGACFAACGFERGNVCWWLLLDQRSSRIDNPRARCSGGL
jgi:hypothetical protein